jgi:hypothetical protein
VVKEKLREAKTERLTITLGEGQRRSIAEIAREQRTSVATVIRWAVDRYLEKQRGAQE